MSVRHIVSRDNPRFKALKKLAQSARERRREGLALLDGMHLIEVYSERCGRPEALIVSEQGASRAEIARHLAALDPTIEVLALSAPLFAELAAVDTPSGIMALIRQPQAAGAPDPDADAVLLDGVQDPGNVGSILRSAAAAGFRQVLLSPDCAQVWSPKTLRAGMGAHFALELFENADLCAFIGAYRGVAAVTEPAAGQSLFAADLTGPLAWIFGSEGAGVRPATAAAARAHFTIPMPGGSESLNAAAAAAVCLFETVRQRLPRSQAPVTGSG
ncbi:TrmH family RNA methyltransferase [Rhodocyclus purpureus]|uniref:TrmH family RNA methyltransferase n=1 Tax=Rhodocyclus purpureus TaxID=1067 RepID=UPI0019120429|nr:RNA methyltransferase [Rhodocyclus purpureus]MBK5915704.1 rRNA methyltransferase [Rhodocyclus purpureus]